MIHRATEGFWSSYHRLPKNVQNLADKKFIVLKNYPRHPSLHLKKIKDYYSVRVGIYYGALGIYSSDTDTIIWFWIGNHKDYDTLIS